ncbi:hypothetical protein ACFXJO_05730 [Streptomyces lavendulae]|uniref:hypothetical protein n=1 Tax=Streptomyces lavendulae TaxID=1914 RepID=UPI0036B83698
MPRCEMDLLLLMAEGRTLAQVATMWGVERGTVHTFAARLRRRLGAETNPQAVLLACRAGILDGRPQRHGDHAGFAAHKYRDEEPCEACVDGERAYRTEQRRARQARQGPQNAA